MTTSSSLQPLGAIGRGVKTFAADVAEGFFEIMHNSMALLGVTVVLGVALLSTHAELRHAGEQRLTAWLTARQTAALGITPEPDAVDRATAANPKELPREQANVALWISKKYRVAPEPIAALVAEAYDVGHTSKLDPTLILAVMAIESSFNPFAQSNVGAQGLMQVMTQIHSDKYQYFGGHYAAFDPKTNLRVGAKVLSDYILRTGSVESGLKWYVGAANLESDGGYAAKVLAEYARLREVARGRSVSPYDNSLRSVSASSPPMAAAANMPTLRPASAQSPLKVADAS